MLLGLIFRESAKDRRSLLSWRAEAKGILPKSVDSDSPKKFVFAGKGGSQPFVARSLSSNKTEKSGGYGWGADIKSEFGSLSSIDKTGYGFGRQGEKAAGLRGFFVLDPRVG
jgi:hypothetical protein